MFKHAGIKRITSVIMEVPCCSALPMMIKKALAASGQTIPMTKFVVSTRGKLLSQR